MRISLIVLLLGAVAMADSHIWIPGTGCWDDPAKWESGVVPSVGDEVYIPEGNYTVFITNPVDVLFVDGGIVMSSSDVKLWSLFNCDYTQTEGSLSVEHIASSHVGVHTGVLSFANVNDSSVNILGAVSVHNLGGLIGDLDGDGKVNLQDLVILTEEWLNEI